MLGHTGLRRFKCTVEGCVSAYNQRVCMRRHYTNVHHFTDETMPDIVPEFRFTLDACMGDVPGVRKVNNIYNFCQWNIVYNLYNIC